MIVLESKKTHKGAYRYVARNTPTDAVFLYDMDGNVYRPDSDFMLKKAGTLSAEAQLAYSKISFHPSNETAAVILKDNAIALSDFSGHLLWKEDGLFDCLMMSNDGNLVWAIEKPDKEHVCVSVFDSTSGSLLTSHRMHDDLYDSDTRISDIPHSNHVIIELAAGQDGIVLYECQFENAILLEKRLPNCSYITPAWSPDGTKLFTLENDTQAYAHFSYPQYELLSGPSDVNFDEEDLCPGYNMIYLKNGNVIIQNANYRLFLFDPVRMERLDEMVFHGYEPVPANQIFKTLKDDTSLYSRIIYFDRIGNFLVARTDNSDEDPAIIFIDEETVF